HTRPRDPQERLIHDVAIRTCLRSGTPRRGRQPLVLGEHPALLSSAPARPTPSWRPGPRHGWNASPRSTPPTAIAAVTPATPAHTMAAAQFCAALNTINAKRTAQAAHPDLLHPAAAKVLATLNREWDGLARHREFPELEYVPPGEPRIQAGGEGSTS
ncbi:MAG: hypothetical protein LC799_03425, partial [Actinobacteria bacterium]|nr:hypothetical protein [Actinomycetota bacterium]